MSSRFFPTWSALLPRERAVLALLLVQALLAVSFFSWFADLTKLMWVQRFVGVPSLMTVLVVVVLSCIGVLRERHRQIGISGWVAVGKRHGRLILVWATLSLVAVRLYPAGDRVQFDEISILLTSKAIHEEREAVTPDRQIPVGHVLKLHAGHIDKRPYFFALVVACFHDVFGYSPRNAFYANMVFASGALALVGLLARRLGRSDWAAGLSMLAMTSVPLFCEYATGGGIDMANVFALLCLFLAALAYLDAPSELHARLVVGTALILAFARYESLLFCALPLLVFGIVYSRERRLYFDWTIPAMACSLLPLAGIHFTTAMYPAENFQFADKGVNAAFSLDYLQRNLEHAARFFLNTEHQLANSIVVFVIGVGAWFLGLVSLPRRMREDADRNLTIVFWGFSLLVLAGFGILMFYSWGELDQPIGSRLSLPLYLLLVLAIPLAIRDLRNEKVIRTGLVAVLLCGAYWQTLPVAAKQYNTRNYVAVMMLRSFDAFLASQPDRRIAVLSGYCNFWTTRDVFAVSASDIDSNPQFLVNMLKSGFYRDVYLIQDSKRALPDQLSAFVMNESSVYHYPLDLESLGEENICDIRKVHYFRILPSSSAKIEAHLRRDGAAGAPVAVKK